MCLQAQEVIMFEITKETMISELLENAPQAMPVFQEIGMHCMGCALASDENIEQACYAHGVDADQFVQKLKAYLQNV
jgi:hybrid cluster-associated redox disulfide protein